MLLDYMRQNCTTIAFFFYFTSANYPKIIDSRKNKTEKKNLFILKDPRVLTNLSHLVSKKKKIVRPFFQVGVLVAVLKKKSP